MIKTVSTIKAIKPEMPPIEKVKFSKDPDVITNYLTDEAGSVKGQADGVYFPADEAELASVVKWASETKTPITVSGGGTGITGSRAPLSGMVISLEKMIRVEEREGWKDFIITVEATGGEALIGLNTEKHSVLCPPGITVGELCGESEKHHLYYPPNPTERSAVIGGNVSTNASGGRSFKYGAIRPWVKSMRVVLPMGEVLAIKRGKVFADEKGEFEIEYSDGEKKKIPIPTYTMPEVKNASGVYARPGMDLIDLFIGCEGILGVYSEIELELAYNEGELFSCIVFFPDEEKALGFVKAARDKARDENEIVDPLTIDYFDEHSLDFMRKSHDDIDEDAKAAVSIEQFLPEDPDEVMMGWMELFEEYEVIDDWSAMTDKDRDRLRLFRHSLPENVNETVRLRKTKKMGMDLAVPDDRLEDLVKIYREKAGASGFDYVLFGHVGDNNLHLNFLAKDSSEIEGIWKVYLSIARDAIEMGGTISAEHGVGKKMFPENGEMHPYLGIMYDREGLDSIARLKKALDPNSILNRGNIIPESYLL